MQKKRHLSSYLISEKNFQTFENLKLEVRVGLSPITALAMDVVQAGG